MNFKDYRWNRNPRGLHSANIYRSFNSDHFLAMNAGWAKIGSGKDEALLPAQTLLTRGITPIVRFDPGANGASAVPEAWYATCQQYIQAGVLWFETYNEINLDQEWPQNDGRVSVIVDWQNTAQCIQPLMDNWLTWAERVINLGGYPAFPAFSETIEPRRATSKWIEACIRYLARNQPSRFSAVVGNGLWCATHPYIYNHWYQQPLSGPEYAARPYTQVSASEGGWHFEYPYDPLQQRDDPGRTAFGGTSMTPWGDPVGLIATGQIFQELLKEFMGLGPVPVIGTEGGINPIPEGFAGGQADTRYQPYDAGAHAEATIAMFRWIAEEAPPWFWGLNLWIEDDYFPGGKPIRAITRLAGEAVVQKAVLDVETTSGRVFELNYTHTTSAPSGPRPTSIYTGPGPIITEVDYHWLILGPGLQADWFFTAAQRYWQTFRPTVLTDWNLIKFVPLSRTLAVTVLARSDTIGYLKRRVRDRWPNIYFDAVVFDTLEEMQATLDQRVDLLKRFGNT
jgi:hypothetical protein